MFVNRSFKLFATFALLVSVLSVSGALPETAVADSPPDSSNVYWWWGELAGSSTIVRTDSGVSGNINTSLSNDVASAKGLAVTLWIVVFNDPSACATSPCTDVDLFDPDVMPDALYGAGTVVGGSEQLSIGFHRNAGDNSGSIADLFGMPTDANGESFGLKDPMGAEIHYVVRSHGPKVPAEMPAQINSFEGGCVTDYFPPTDPGDLQLGEGECQDLQFAINQ
jgi:hypothetical protein